jgi:hypothetical protein
MPAYDAMAAAPQPAAPVSHGLLPDAMPSLHDSQLQRMLRMLQDIQQSMQQQQQSMQHMQQQQQSMQQLCEEGAAAQHELRQQLAEQSAAIQVLVKANAKGAATGAASGAPANDQGMWHWGLVMSKVVRSNIKQCASVALQEG